MKKLWIVGCGLLLWGSAQADPWGWGPSRRAQVLSRDHAQMRRVDRLEREGRLSPWEANRLERQDRSIRRQEQWDAARHGGHLTWREQRRLNGEENRVNREIRHHEWR